MANDSVGLEVLISAVLSARGFEDLKAQLKASAAAHQEAKPAVNDFQQAIQNLGSSMVANIAGFIAIGTAVAFIKGSIEAAVKESRSLDQFDAANRRLGESTADLTAKNHEWLKAVEDASGISKTELIPAYGRLSEITTTVAATQGLLQIAAGAAARGMGDLTTISNTLAKSLLTGAARATGEFGLILKKLHDDGKSTADIIKVLTARFGDAGANVHNAGIELDRMRVANERAKAGLGETGATLLTELAPAMKYGMVAIAMVEAGFIKLVGAIKSMGSTLGGLDAMMSKFFHGDFTGGIAAWKAGWAEGDAALKKSGDHATDVIDHVLSGFDNSAARLKAANDKMMADIVAGLAKPKGSIDDLKKQYDFLLEAAKHSGDGQVASLLNLAKVYDKMAEDARLGANEQQKAANKRIEIIGEIGKLTAREAVEEAKAEADKQKAIKKTGDDWIAGEKKRIDTERKDWDQEAKEDLKNFETRHKNDLHYLDEFTQFTADMLANWKGTEAEKTKFSISATETRIKIAQSEKQQSDALMASSITTLGNYFKIGKELSIAQAIINTYEGATKALAQGGIYGEVLAAIVIAAGLADVATIASTGSDTGGSFTGPEGGFDSPTNDYAAYQGGQRWAQDMVENAGAGWADRLGSIKFPGGSSSTSNVSNVSNRGGDTHIHIHSAGIMGNDDVQARLLVKRILPHLVALDPRRTLR